MKKSLVAVGVIIALGAVWTGASWYTGKQLAQRIDTVTAELNKQVQQAYPNSGLKVVYRDYQGGVFSSTFALVLQADSNAAGTPALTPGTEIVMNETVSHGPLPLANLKKFNLIPALASVHSEIANTEATKSLFDLLQGQPFFSAETRVAFNGDSASVISLRPLDLAENDGKFQFSGSDISLDLSSDLRAGRISGNVAKVVMEKVNPQGDKELVTVEGLALQGDSQRGKFDLNNGTGLVSIKSLAIVPQNGESVSFNNFVVKSSSREDDKNLSGEFSIALDAMLMKDRNLGSAQFNLAFSQLDGEGAKQFVQAYQKLSAELITSGANADPTEFNHLLGLTFMQHLPQLLKGNPSVSISPISWKNAKGESTFNLVLDLTNPVQTTPLSPEAQSDEEALIRRSVKKLDITFNAPMPMLAEAMVQVGGQPQSDEERKQLTASALEQVKLFAGIGEMNQMTVTKDDAITSALHYADNQIDFNGRKLTLAEFIAPFTGISTDEGDEGDESDEPTPDSPAVTQPQ